MVEDMLLPVFLQGNSLDLTWVGKLPEIPALYLHELSLSGLHSTIGRYLVLVEVVFLLRKSPDDEYSPTIVVLDLCYLIVEVSDRVQNSKTEILPVF